MRAVQAVPERWCLMAADAAGNRFPGVRRRVKGAGLWAWLRRTPHVSKIVSAN
ncbi:MAG TPA: hypothetical protein VM186_13020 [Planctomycetota bacterium]|nr:hypothetical protein [Planctomycetota bacterium]